MTEGGGLGLGLWLSGKRAEVCVLRLKEEARGGLLGLREKVGAGHME